jgi:hypothetical protein
LLIMEHLAVPGVHGLFSDDSIKAGALYGMNA